MDYPEEETAPESKQPVTDPSFNIYQNVFYNSANIILGRF